MYMVEECAKNMIAKYGLRKALEITWDYVIINHERNAQAETYWRAVNDEIKCISRTEHVNKRLTN